MKILVGMSGGIDSAVAALLMLEQGYCVDGATMSLCRKISADGTDMTLQDISDAKSVCDKIGIQHKVYELEESFHSTVIKDFTESYISGKTPNPCIICNKRYGTAEEVLICFR